MDGAAKRRPPKTYSRMSSGARLDAATPPRAVSPPRQIGRTLVRTHPTRRLRSKSSTFWSKESQTGSQGRPDLIKGGAALDQRNAAVRSLARPRLTTRGFSKVPQGFTVQGHRLSGDPHRLVAPSLRGRSGRQSGRNRSSESPKPITEGTQTLHKGRSEIAQGELKPLTRGANQIQSRRSDRQSPRNRPSESPKHPTRGTQTLHKGRRETAQGELKTPTRGTKLASVA